jgi:hypothetical protein
MKTITLKTKIVMALLTIFLACTGIVLLTNNPFGKAVKSYLENHEIAASIIYSALFIIGFNVMIFAIGYFAKDKVKKAEIVKRAYRKNRITRRRKLESRQFSVLSHTR